MLLDFFFYTCVAAGWLFAVACVFSITAVIGLYGMWVYYRLTGKDVA